MLRRLCDLAETSRGGLLNFQSSKSKQPDELDNKIEESGTSHKHTALLAEFASMSAAAPMDRYDQLRRRTIQNATVLWSLTDLPERPTENQISSDVRTGTLSIKRERQLAEDFAFIACTRDVSEEVIAVCVEEHKEESKLLIRVASNSGDINYAVAMLRSVAALMMEAATPDVSRSETKRTIFAEIVWNDRSRILSRLRSKHAIKTLKTRGKKSLPLFLLQTIRKAAGTNNEDLQTALQQTQEHCHQFWAAFSRLEEQVREHVWSESAGILEEIVHLAYRFQLNELRSTLDLVKDLEPTSKAYILEAIPKLGRYRVVADNLANAASNTKHTIFRNIVVVPIDYQAVDIERVRGGLCGFTEALRNARSRAPKLKLSGIKVTGDMTNKYQEQLFKSTLKWKVHAEIQLVYFYELNSSPVRPRIIAASKSACYLCDLFLKTHGDFQTPSTHGRLYGRWFLPRLTLSDISRITALLPAILRVNEALEKKIVDVLTHERQRFGHPAESRLCIQQPWSSNSTIRPPTHDLPESIDSTTHDNIPLDGLDALERDVLASCEHLVRPSQSSSSLGSSHREHRKRVERGSHVLISTEVANLDFSFLDCSSDIANVQGGLGGACWVEVRVVVTSNVESGAIEGALTIDLDDLQPGNDTRLRVGAACSPSSLVLTRTSWTVALEVRFVR